MARCSRFQLPHRHIGQLGRRRPDIDAVVRPRDRRRIVKNTAGRNMMSGPGGTGGAAGDSSGAMAALSIRSNSQSDLDRLDARIAHLVSAIEQRTESG